MKKNLLIILLLCLSGFYLQAQTTTVYIVRHGEKAISPADEKDPVLSKEGIQRSKDLAKYLAQDSIAAIFSTPYKRTRQTVTPLAQKRNLPIFDYNPSAEGELVAIVKSNYEGKTVVVAAHSNTMLSLIEAFGGIRPADYISDATYDVIFKMIISPDNIKVETALYGKKSND